MGRGCVLGETWRRIFWTTLPHDAAATECDTSSQSSRAARHDAHMDETKQDEDGNTIDHAEGNELHDTLLAKNLAGKIPL